MTYFITPGQNRYFLNEAQRQVLIDCELEDLLLDGWAQAEVNRHENWLVDLDNKELVEEVCGNQWEGFVGQTTTFA